MGLGKGAMRKLWSGAKDAVLKNKTLTKDEKSFVMTAFKDDLGPKLDDFETLAGKGRSEKLMLAYEKVTKTLQVYGQKLTLAHNNRILNESDAEHLGETLAIVSKEAKLIYDKVMK